MKSRCTNPNNSEWRDYGGRGITVYKEWLHSFEAFYGYVGPKLGPQYSLGRKDNDRGYLPGNVRWENAEQQNNNRRSNVWYTHNGETLSVGQWARRVGITRAAFRDRLANDWPPAQLLAPKCICKNESRLMTVDGVTGTAKYWASVAGMSPYALRYRLDKLRLPIEAAIRHPVDRRRIQKRYR